jgi:thiamine-monophosphate kinase
VRALTAGEQPSIPVLAHFVRPVARLAEAKWLAEHGAVAAIDISDGLAGDLAHVAAASGVEITIDGDAVPQAGGTGYVTFDDVVAGGEEYELAVIAPAGLDRAAFQAAFGVPLTDIGTVSAAGTRGTGVTVTHDGRYVDPPRSWDHFSE